MPIRRTLKNVVKNYSTAEVAVREATSNDPWGPANGLMGEIARMTYDMVSFTEIMQIIWKRLNDSGKNWRHVYKSLLLLDYLVRAGSENVVRACRENIYTIQTLRDFQFVEEGKDYGLNVREKAKAFTQLLKDDEQLKKERAKMSSRHHDRLGYGSRDLESSDGYNQSRTSSHAPEYPPQARARSASLTDTAQPSSALDEERQLQMALAMSKQEHEAELKQKQAEEAKVAMAIEASKKEVVQKPEKPAPRGVPVDLFTNDDDFDVNDLGLEMQLQDPWGAPARAAVPPASASTNFLGHTDPWASNTTGAAKTNDPWDLPSYDAFSRQQPATQLPNYSSSAASWNPSAAPSAASWNPSAAPSAASWNTGAAPSSQFNNNKIILDNDFDVFNTQPLPASSQPLSTVNTTATKDTTGILDLVDFDNLLGPQNRTAATNRSANSNMFSAPKETAPKVPMNAMGFAAAQSVPGYQAYPAQPSGGMSASTSLSTGRTNNSNPFL